MTLSQAIEIVESNESDESDALQAWRHLIDTGVVWVLQGWYGRTATALIDAGLCNPT